jgi:FkbM family methyltransferase
MTTIHAMARWVARLDTNPVLVSLLRDADLQLVDVGARGRPRPELVALAPYARLVAIEPDEDEARRLEVEQKDGPWQAYTVVPAAIAERVGDATLYMTASPGMSSLLEPDPAVFGRFVNADAFAVVGTASVPTIPLDQAARDYGFQDACFVKVDTQGTELEILRSGPELLRNTVGVYVETLFRPFYKAQSLFADVDAYLRGSGFELVELRRTGLRSGSFRPSLYSEHQITWAHCLYFRDPAALAGRAVSRMICMALVYGQHDLALDLAATHDGRLVGAIEEYAARATRRRLRHRSPPEQEKLLAKSRRD